MVKRAVYPEFDVTEYQSGAGNGTKFSTYIRIKHTDDKWYLWLEAINVIHAEKLSTEQVTSAMKSLILRAYSRNRDFVIPNEFIESKSPFCVLDENQEDEKTYYIDMINNYGAITWHNQ